MKIRSCSILIVLLALGLPLSLQAAGGTPTPDQINAVAKELWCPLCNGVRLDNCDLQACVQMRELIAQKLSAGESKEQIKADMVAQYGDVVLGVPANQGFNSLAWILPVLAVVVALAWLVYFVVTWTRRRPAAAKVRPPAPTAGKDDYMKRVDDELKRYE